MSDHVSAWAWAQDVKSGSEKVVLIKLANQANDDGICSASQRTLALECGISESTVRRVVKELAHRGLIDIEKKLEQGRRTVNVYHFPAIGQGDLWRPPPEVMVTGPPEVMVTSPSKQVRSTRLEVLNPSAGKTANELWDAFAAFSPTPQTTSERGAWNGAIKELRLAGVSASEIPRIVERYRTLWPQATLTLPAIAKHLGLLRGRVSTKPEPTDEELAASTARREALIAEALRELDEKEAVHEQDRA